MNSPTMHQTCISKPLRNQSSSRKRSPPILLQPKKFTNLFQRDPGNPLLRRHLAMLQIMKIIDKQTLCDPCQTKFTLYRVPHPVQKLVNHLNQNYLTKSTDIPLDPKNAWKNLFRHIFGNGSSYNPSSHSNFINHRAICFTNRRWTNDEIILGRQKRSKPQFKSPISPDLHSIETFTTIDHTSCHNVLYIANDLHPRSHLGFLDPQVLGRP